MQHKKTTIVVIGAYPHLKDGRWQTSGVDDPGDHAGATFDRFRMFAGRYLADNHPDAPLLLSGGAMKADIPSCAQVLKDELMELGIPDDRLILEEDSHSVHQQLYYIARMMRDKNLGHLLIITNDWHHPRLKAMMEHAPQLEAWRDGSISWEKIDAEHIMLDSGDPDWAAMVAAERVHPKYYERVTMEAQGLTDVVSGTYKYLPIPE